MTLKELSEKRRKQGILTGLLFVLYLFVLLLAAMQVIFLENITPIVAALNQTLLIVNLLLIYVATDLKESTRQSAENNEKLINWNLK